VRVTLIALYNTFSDSMACHLIKPADFNLICLKNHFSASQRRHRPYCEAAP